MDTYTRLRALVTDFRETLRWYTEYGTITPAHIEAMRHLHYGLARSMTIVTSVTMRREYPSLMAVYGVVGDVLASLGIAVNFHVIPLVVAHSICVLHLLEQRRQMERRDRCSIGR